MLAAIALVAARTFVVDGSVSAVTAHLGKTGLFQVAGHEHTIVARDIQGEIALDERELSRSSVDLVVSARSLEVSEKGEPEGDAPKVREAMRGPGALDVARFGTVHFASASVSGKQTGPGAFDLTVSGEFSLHGVTQSIAVPVHVEVAGSTLTASGKFPIRQTDYGIEPTTAAGGLVKVENEVTLSFRISARAQ